MNLANPSFVRSILIAGTTLALMFIAEGDRAIGQYCNVSGSNFGNFEYHYCFPDDTCDNYPEQECEEDGCFNQPPCSGGDITYCISPAYCGMYPCCNKCQS